MFLFRRDWNASNCCLTALLAEADEIELTSALLGMRKMTPRRSRFMLFLENASGFRR